MQQTIFHRPDFVILTGGPGAGKTTLIETLHRKGFNTVPEAARQIIRQQVAQDGTALPWKDTTAYTHLMLERSAKDFTGATNRPSTFTFFDRGIPDALAYARLINLHIIPEMDQYALQYRYCNQVFILPFWEAIYATDAERKQTKAEALLTFHTLAETYTAYGYAVIEVPIGIPEQRAQFVLNQLQLLA